VTSFGCKPLQDKRQPYVLRMGREWVGEKLQSQECRRLQDLFVLQGTTKSTRKKSQEFRESVPKNPVGKGSICGNFLPID